MTRAALWRRPCCEIGSLGSESESARAARASEPLKKAITAAASEKIAQAMLAEGPCPRGCKLAPDVKGEETAKGAKKTT
eukprot:5288519-Pyramimonas_sp.AAC.1